MLFHDQPFLLSMVNKCPIIHTPVDWKETSEAHVFVVNVPGLTKDKVNVDIIHDHDGHRVLQISGERAGPEDESGGEKDNKNINNNKWRRVERFHGKFERRIRLPENVDTDNVTAAIENGVLTVRVPKKELNKPEKKVVEIQAGN